MKKHKIWQFNEFNREEAENLAQQAGVSPLVAGILLNRGIKDAKSVREFLYGSAEPYHDPVFNEGYAQSGRTYPARH